MKLAQISVNGARCFCRRNDRTVVIQLCVLVCRAFQMSLFPWLLSQIMLK